MRTELKAGLGLLSIGAGLAALGGLEKIILYIARADYVGDSVHHLRLAVPDGIWLITNITFWSGIPLVLAGLYLLLRGSLARMGAQISAANERFEREHNQHK